MDPFWAVPWGEQPRFDAKPWECPPEEAQRYLNFPLLWLEEQALPEGTSVTKLTVRPEGEERWSSARVTVAGRGRRLRLKQYHFDWWRPTEITGGLQRALGFYRAGQAVVAWGRDLRGRAAARMAWGRTMVDLRIERGTFIEIELRHLLASLHPAIPEALPLLTGSPFHRVSYHVRRGWGPSHLDELAAADWYDGVPASPFSPLLLPAVMPLGWRLDAVATWSTPPPRETQWLLRDEWGGTVCYARARPTEDAQPLKLPALYRRQEGWHARQTLVRRRRATVAYQHPDLGGWSAAWAESGHRYQFFVRAGALGGERAFLELLQTLQSLR